MNAASLRRGALALLSFAWLVLPQTAAACFVCYGGEDNDWTPAFVSGTIMMLGLPPAIVLGAGFAIYRSIKRTEAYQAQAAADDADSSKRPD
ncbi:MAG: hypothetical protein VCC00_00995 [Deltaproteobacteria bacterium]